MISPYYDRSGIIMYNCNCVHLMAHMDEKSVDLTITSPPYDKMRIYNGFSFDFESVVHGLFRVTRDGGEVIVRSTDFSSIWAMRWTQLQLYMIIPLLS